MLNNFQKIRPTPLLLGSVVSFLVLLIYNRAIPDNQENLPVFYVFNEKKSHVELTIDGIVDGVYQINDGSTLCDVIKLTNYSFADTSPSCDISLVNGQRYFFKKKARRIELVEKGWMSAGRRMALAVPLHPDRMTLADWQSLPGIGEKLAVRIETDRQKNGEFGSLENLVRVKGIGQKGLDKWRNFFVGS